MTYELFKQHSYLFSYVKVFLEAVSMTINDSKY